MTEECSRVVCLRLAKTPSTSLRAQRSNPSHRGKKEWIASSLTLLANDGESLSRLLRPAQQEHALLAEHVPEPPGRAQPQRTAVEVERHRALHLDIDLVAELHKVLDGAEMDVRRVVPGRGQVFGARHVAADQELQPHPPEAEIRERDDGAAADPQQVFQDHPRLPRRLQGLRQDYVVESI